MSHAHRLEGEAPVSLADFDPAPPAGVTREAAEAETARLLAELAELQELLHAVGRQSVLMVLQGRDTSGKDGTIRRVMGALSPQGVSVTVFGPPTDEERAHDFLWRVYPHAPRAGQVRVFNRSHYEDVLVARVRGLVPEEVWRPRYGHINAFERMLADSSTLVLKFFLHLSAAEQEKRLLKREEDPVKSWKLAVGDWEEREYWDAYTAAYEEALTRCAAPHAPWLVVPADRKWFRNLAVAEALRDALAPYRERWMEEVRERGREGRRALEAYRRARGG